ncbi:hypothetical protein AgCh_032192 [Apium graveolens]
MILEIKVKDGSVPGRMRTLTHCSEGKIEQALDFMSQSVHVQCPIFELLFNSCKNSKALQLEKKVHKFFIRSPFKSDVELNYNLIEMDVKCGIMRYARRIFDRMEQGGAQGQLNLNLKRRFPRLLAPRRRHAGKEPMADSNQRPRAVVPRADPSNLLPLGDPDDPTPPFTEEIMNSHISRKFKMPTIKAYDGTGDPTNHVRTFSNALLLQPVNDAIKCRAFPQTLSGMAQRWYSHLPPNSIGSFRELSQAFIKQFISGRVHESTWEE